MHCRGSAVIATCGGIGYLPIAPGTWGSALGWVFLWLLRDHSLLIQALLTMVVTMLAVATITGAERFLQSDDDGRIVIDETAGMMLALGGVPWSWSVWLAGFVLFRLLDIIKPGPLRRLEGLRSPWGVLLDDAAAGLVTNGALQVWLSLSTALKTQS